MAGLACACELVDAGLDVILLEARDRLGGRAHSFREKTTGALIDNCQHVILGCCEAAIGFLTRIGSIGLVEFSEEIEFVGENGKRLRIGGSRLPPPLHLLPSVMRSDYLPAFDKLRLAGVMAGLAARAPGNAPSAEDYLRSLGCSDALLSGLFEPILISALNERAAEASAQYARFVLTRSLLQGRGSYALGVPRAPLSQVVGEPAAAYLGERGCEIRLGAKVRKLNFRAGSVASAMLDSGEDIQSDLWVSATRPADLAAMGLALPAACELGWRPIVSAHLFFEKPHPDPSFDSAQDVLLGGEGVGAFKHACVVGEPFGWVFNKSRGFEAGRGCVQAVASAAGPIAHAARSDLTYLAMRAAAKAAPGIEKLKLVNAVFVREMHATFSTAHRSPSARPPASTVVPNLFIAGDWTDTGWPATIESAVRSGHAAAQGVVEQASRESARLGKGAA